METMLAVIAMVWLVVAIVTVAVSASWARARNFGWKGTATTILSALLALCVISFGDHTFGEIEKQKLCEEVGGTRIVRVVEDVEGLMKHSSRQSPPYRTIGYDFLEFRTANGEIFRYSRRPDGSVDEERVDQPLSKYVARFLPEEKIGTRHVIRRFAVIEISSDQVVGAHGTVAYKGGWLGMGSRPCMGGDQSLPDYDKFIHEVLKPRTNRG